MLKRNIHLYCSNTDYCKIDKKMRTLYKFNSAFIFLLISLSFFSCGDDRLDVDISDVQVNLKVHRFEKELFETDSNNFAAKWEELFQKYPVFTKSFIIDIMDFGDPSRSELTLDAVKAFINHPSLRELYKVTQEKFDDFKPFEKDLELALKYFKYHFPEYPTPEVFTMISEFTYGHTYYDSAVAVGLDFYLGSDFKYYPGLGFTGFLIRKMSPEYLVPNTINSWIISCFEPYYKEENCLDKMVFEGKVWYLMDACFPDMHDSLKFGLSADQLKWLKNNEYQIWAHFIEKKLLYEKDHLVYRNYFEDGPFTSAPGVPAESSPMIGKYLGYRIVQTYLENFPEITLLEFVKNTNSAAILNDSGYKP